MLDNRLHPLPQGAGDTTFPSQFTYPFCYEAHPLCRLAADEVKSEICLHADWNAEIRRGKMLGVLVTDRGFLAAFSGTLCGKSTLPYFVPPVFDLHDTYFEEEEARISALPMGEERRRRSQLLQEWLFQQYHFLNAEGHSASLLSLFPDRLPPAGTGDCCAPKLLQYAYAHGLRPLSMAEFWMGESPRGEIREEGHFYPACQHKCKPVLSWMLRGLDVEPNPMLKDYDQIVHRLQVVHENRDFLVFNKPSGLLSVPGKDNLPSLQDLVRQHYPQATGPLIVQRLDMDTSGLMVVALNEPTYHELQQQFITHKVAKRYSALLEHPMPIGTKGTIDLPLCPNPDDRPRQVVNYEYGRRAITRFEVAGNIQGHALLHLWPETGRTHQLRVHLAHPQGLGNPILGDRLYGHAGQRLMLEADRLEFNLGGHVHSFAINHLIKEI